MKAARTGSGRPSSAHASRPRRESIYPHRAVRYVGQKGTRVLAAILLAAALTVAIAAAAQPLATWQMSVVRLMMNAAGIPAESWQSVSTYPGTVSFPAPATPIPAFRELGDVPRLLPIAFVVGVLIVSRRLPLAQSLAGFLVVLLIGSAVLSSLYPDYRLGSATFTAIWFQLEFAAWLAMPWMSALLFVAFQPRMLSGILLAILAQVYGMAFGALRFTFFLGMLHHTGLLFLPVLWLSLGVLANLLFILTFYSLSVHRAASGAWGARAAWV